MHSFRFVHCADIHLDSPLRGLAGEPGPAAERVRGATREAFDELMGRAIEEAVDFVVIAGDLYDGDWRDYHTGLFFVHEMGRLAAAAIPVYLLYGNHDAESQITRRLTLPDNVHVFASRKPQTYRLKALSVALHGQSFRSRDITDDLAAAYPAPVSGCFNIGVLHTALDGAPGHAPYAPCSLSELVAKGYQYWALGHVHDGRVVHEHPHVVFSGNLQGRHIRETGPKGAYLVTAEAGDVVGMERLVMDAVRWAHLNVPADGCETGADVVERVRETIKTAVDNEAGQRLLACRIEITGRTAAHEWLLASDDTLQAEAQAAAAGLGDAVAWVERVVVATEPMVDPEARRGREDPVGELHRVFREAPADPALVERLDREIGDMVRKLPHEIRDGADETLLRAVLAGDYTGLMDNVGRYLEARLLREED